MSVELICRNGWYYGVARRGRGYGRAIRWALGTQDAREAEALVKSSTVEQNTLAAKSDALGLDVLTRMVAGRKVRVRDAIESYALHRDNLGRAPATLASQASTLDCFLRHTGLANEPIGAIRPAHVSSFVNRPDAGALSNREFLLSVIGGFLSYCTEQRWLPRNPRIDVAVKLDGLTQEQLMTHQYEPFTEEEVRSILAKLPRNTFAHGAVLFGYHFGLRISSVLELEDVNVVGNQLRIYTRKGRREVNQPLPQDLIEWLALWRTIRPQSDTGYLFPAEMAMGTKQVSTAFGRSFKAMGFVNRSFAGLRKTAAYRVWNNAMEDLGGKEGHALAKMVAERGYRTVQKLLAHSPGSDVTGNHYLPRTK